VFKIASLAVLATVACAAPAMAAEPAYIHDAVKAQCHTIYAEAFSKGNLKAVDGIIAPNCIDHEMVMPGQKQGLDGFKATVVDMRKAFPDLKIEMVDFSYSKGKAFVRYHMTGTNKGAFMGKPATGKKVDLWGFDEIRFKNGLAVEHWGQGDDMALMQQLGMMQQPPAASKKPADKK
jgi:steroid delta-isomerase-like uncharacterized protein